MTIGGQTDHDNNYGYWNQEKNHIATFDASVYFTNRENYAWNFSRAVTTAMYGANQEAPFFNQEGPTPWQLPLMLFKSRNPGAPIKPFSTEGQHLTEDRFEW